MYKQIVWTQQQHQPLSETTEHEYPELDDKSSKEFIMSIYICYFSTYYYGKISLHKVKQ